MAWRPSEWVLEGELDNTQRGWTIGWVRIEGRDEPLELKLAGNCHPDLVEQAKQNSAEMDYFMFQISDALTDIKPEDEEPEPPTC